MIIKEFLKRDSFFCFFLQTLPDRLDMSMEIFACPTEGTRQVHMQGNQPNGKDKKV